MDDFERTDVSTMIIHYSPGGHCVLVDYKTYPGADIDEHVKKYYAQLSAYAHALRSSGIDVTHTLVYYPVQECIVYLL